MASSKSVKPRRRDQAAKLTAELGRLTERLREAEETIDAIRGGHVDALVVHGPAGEQVFTLLGADHRYRQLVETMNEGALLIDRDGVIVYGNARFAQLVELPLERLIASKLRDFVGDDGQRTLAALLDGRSGQHAKAEVALVTASGARTPIYLSATASWEDDGQLTCVIATDLSAQKRNQELVAAEQLTSMIVEQAAESVVVCDLVGRVIRASNAAHRAGGQNPLLQPFERAFQLCDGDGREASLAVLDATRSGETISGLELTLTTAEGAVIDVLVSAGPIRSRDGRTLGSVISFVDITERKRLASERQALLETTEVARSEAEDASRAKDEFLAMLGHELRNPLAPILTALELIRDRSLAGEISHEHQIIERQVKHVVTLVDDLLDVSRITRGKIELDRRPVELAQIVARAVELASPLIEDRGHHLEVDVPAGLRLAADETRIAQVISNLLVNAAKYTECGGTIAVYALRDRDELVLRVRDNGMGIPPDILPHLFERFVQGARTIDRAEGGLGLGLAIVSSLVEMHGGSVRAHSAGIGKGSEFEVRLPALAPAAAEARIAAGTPTAIAVPPPVEACRVLVVDDNTDAADLLAEALERMGHSTRVAYDGPSALRVAAEFLPEIAVLDIGLPVMDGFELAQRIRHDLDPSGDMRLIALTGYGQESDRRRSSEAGFDSHMVKPVELGALARTIRRLHTCADRSELAR